MKISLVACLLLLVTLTCAEGGEIYAKLLFDAGYVIAEGYDARMIQHFYQWPYFDDVWFVFKTQDDDAKYRDSWSQHMYLDRNKFNETPSFAIDSRKDSSENMGTCLDQSDEKMKHLIHSCAGNMALRALTEEERAKMQQYKKEQQESKKPLEAVFSESGVTIKSADIINAFFDDTIGLYGYRTLSFNTTINSGERHRQMYVMAKPAGRSFVIESLPFEGKEKCGKIGLEDLLLAHCEGNLQIRSN